MDRPIRSPFAILAQAVIALMLSALLLLLASWVYVEYLANDQQHAAARVAPLSIPGKSLQVVYGTGQAEGEALRVTGYQAADDGQIAIAVRDGEFSADDFPLLQFGLDIPPGGPNVDLIWRLAAEPDMLQSMALSDTDARSAWLDLKRNPDWHGKVLEIGIYVAARDTGHAVSLAHLTLEPRSWWGELGSHWHDWTEYRGWSLRSINYLYGSVDAHSLSPVVVAAAWAALAVVLLLIAGVRAGGVNAGALVALLLLVWIALDLLWQHELDTQLANTRQQFAGKTAEEKHLADLDAPVYRYIQRLKREVLPKQVSRILVLHNSRRHNFERLKAQYYLLPHNVFNFGRVPPGEKLHNVDYVLLLGDVPDVEYHADSGSLQWRRGHRSLPVERIDSDPMGSVFRVLPATGSGKGKL